jgi:predicted glycoside hydrolase/deacetylase ChbG (UPF0249 family)
MMTTRFLPIPTVVAGLIVTMPPAASAQSKGPEPRPTLAQRLGYGPDAKLLIIHADDIGVAHSVNAAALTAITKGAVNSGSIMVPCPWFPEIAAYVRDHPGLDLGLHLTLTAEWKEYRWGSVLPADQVPTLLDSLGFLYPTEAEAAQHMDPHQAEAEIRAQVERALAFGIRPTHLDSHMGTLFQSPALFEAYLRVGRDYKIPVFVPGDALRAQAPQLLATLTPQDIVIDHLDMATPDVSPAHWEAYYTGLIEQLQPGVTEIIVHVAHDDDEMEAVTVDHPDYGAAWRQRDFDVVTSAWFKRLLEQHHVRMITWRELGSLVK